MMQYNLNYKEKKLTPFYFRKTRSQPPSTAKIQNASQYLSTKVSQQCSKDSKHDSYHRYLSKKKGCVLETNTPILVENNDYETDDFVWEIGDIVFALSSDKRYFRSAIIVDSPSSSNGIYTIQFNETEPELLRPFYEIEPYRECNEVFMSNGKIYVPDDFDCTHIVYTPEPKYNEQYIINKAFF